MNTSAGEAPAVNDESAAIGRESGLLPVQRASVAGDGRAVLLSVFPVLFGDAVMSPV